MEKRFSPAGGLCAFVAGFLILFFPAVFLFSLDPGKRVSQYMADAWSIEDGLPQNSVSSIIMTSEGYLCVGTEEGVVRFDGVHFDIYDKRNVEQLSSHYIKHLYEDRAGNLWIGTYGGGLMCLEKKNSVLKTYTVEQGLAHKMVWTVLEDEEGALWIGTSGGLNRLEDGKFTTYTTREGLPHDQVSCLYPGRGGTLWIGTFGGVCRMDPSGPGGREFTTFTTREGLSDNRVMTLYRDRTGGVWIGTERGLNRMNPPGPPDGRFTIYTTAHGLSNHRIRSICEDRDGNFWIGTYGGGLNRMDTGTGTFFPFTQKDGLSDNSILCVLEDPEGSLWIGTYNGGLNRLQDGKFLTYTTGEGLSDNGVETIYEDSKGFIWIGTNGGGLNRLDVKTGAFTVISKPEGLTSDLVRAFHEDRDGTFWVGTDGGGLNRLVFNKKNGAFTITGYSKQDGLPNDAIKALGEDRDGNLWIGTEDGLARLDLTENNGKFITYTTEHGLTSGIIRAIRQDRRGNLWVGTDGGGLNRLALSKKNGTLSVTPYTTRDGLSSDLVRDIYEDDEGTLWIGTKDGLNRLKNGTITPITTRNGLYNDVVFRILEDDTGNFWMSCNRGIFTTPRTALNRFCDGKQDRVPCDFYDKRDGMRSRECNGSSVPAGWKTRDGRLWFPTIEGAVVIEPGNIKINRQPPPVVIEEITAGDRSIHFLLFSLSASREKIRLAPGTERFEIHYAALSFLAPSKVRFKYRLQGVDKEWVDAGTRRVAYYTKVPPGNYTFRVVACNNDGTWNNAGASVSFYLKPFFYQTRWFYVLCAFSVLFLALFTYFRRVRQFTNRKAELERLVSERTRQLAESNRELEKLSIVARETDNAVLIMDARGNFQWVNQGFTRVYGYTLEQLIAERGPSAVGLSAHPEFGEVIAKFPRERKPVHYESFHITRFGKKVWSHTALTPVFDSDGNLSRIVSIDSDITRLKESENKIKKQNEEILLRSRELQEAVNVAQKEREAANAANMAKSEFLARMSHEIRTPMNGILGFTDMMLDSGLNEEQMDYARTISRSGEALTALLNDILDFSRIEAGELTITPIDFDPEVTLFDVVEIILPRIANIPVELMCRIGDNVPAYVKGDAGRFRQVLINLLGNAAKFTPSGEITLSLEVEEEKDETFGFHITVKDTGIGIPPGKLETIFDVFQQVDGSTTREYGGTGLGLAISRRIARLMGGDVRAESVPGEGSTFHFTCRMETSGKEPGKQEKSKKEGPVTPRAVVGEAKDSVHILLAEDNPINQKLALFMLSKAGYRVSVADDGKKAVDLFSSAPERFDLIFMDVQMPRMNGLEAVRAIREKGFTGIPIVAMTAQSMKGDREKCLESGMNDYISKPIKREIVFAMVKKWVRQNA